MPDLREEILRYLWEGYREYKQGRRETCLLLDYLRDECVRTFRIAVKRGYYQWLRAEGRDRVERAGELLLLLVDALLNDDRLKGKAGKCEPMCEQGELAPLGALGLRGRPTASCSEGRSSSWAMQDSWRQRGRSRRARSSMRMRGWAMVGQRGSCLGRVTCPYASWIAICVSGGS